MRKKINITVDTDLLKQIDKLAKDSNRSRSNYIETVINKYLEDKKNGKQ